MLAARQALRPHPMRGVVRPGAAWSLPHPGVRPRPHCGKGVCRQGRQARAGLKSTSAGKRRELDPLPHTMHKTQKS